MCGARGRDREGVIRRSRPRLLKLGNLSLKIFDQDFDLESSMRRHLRWGGRSLRAFRRAMIDGKVAKGTTTTWKFQTFQFTRFRGATFPNLPKSKKQNRAKKMAKVVKIDVKHDHANHASNLVKNFEKTSPDPPQTLPKRFPNPPQKPKPSSF